MNIQMHCDGCGADTVSDLNRWAAWYTDGEVFWETCSGCGIEYEVTITARTKEGKREG